MGLNSRQRNTLLTDDETSKLKKAFITEVYSIDPDKEKDGETFMGIAINILAEKAGIGWSSTAHTCVNVPVYAIGTGSENFSGCIDNTDIPKLIAKLMGIIE